MLRCSGCGRTVRRPMSTWSTGQAPTSATCGTCTAPRACSSWRRCSGGPTSQVSVWRLGWQPRLAQPLASAWLLVLLVRGCWAGARPSC